MIPFKYRLVTEEAKCGSMGRTRHLLWEHQGQEIGSRGGQDPMATPGLQGPMYIVPLSLPLPILRLCSGRVPFWDG